MKPFKKESFVVGNVPRQWDFLLPFAADLGFVAVGVAGGGAVPRAHRSRYERFLEHGYQADMHYLECHLDERWDVRQSGIVAHANAVIAAAFPFGSGSTRSGFWRHVAPYARGTDYHESVRERLNILSRVIGERFPGSRRRVFVDTAPILERSWALSAGISELLKNGMVMVPGVGPRVVLGEVVCSGVPTVPSIPQEEPFRLCEGCTRCIDSCPTNALLAPAELDGRQCLSYWTIENRKDPLPRPVAGEVQTLFGCDRCISCCPHDNPDGPCALSSPTSGKQTNVEVADFCRLDDTAISSLVQSTPLARTGPIALRRNASLFERNRR